MVSDALLRARERAARLRERAEESPLQWMDWTRKQAEFRQVVETAPPDVPAVLLRAGNQVGKTIVGAACTIEACLRGGAGFEAWVVCTSWSQAVSVMSKVYSLVPKDAIDDRSRQRFSARDGWGKDNPTVQFRNGAILRFKTTLAGPGKLASGTIHWVWIDEPTTQAAYRELQKRVRKNRGRVIITLTPVNLPCEWLRELVERGAVVEVHARLDADALTFVRSGQRMRLGDGTPMDDAWIARERFNTPEVFVPVVCDGEWETRVSGTFFRMFSREIHITPPPRWASGLKRSLSLGIDYAAADRELGLTCVLVEVGEKKGDRAAKTTDDWSVYVHDEVVLPGSADLETFAAAIVAMLQRNGLRWEDLAHVWGDNPTRSRFDVKSNILLGKEIARELGVPNRALRPVIWNAKEGRRTTTAVDIGCRWLNTLMVKRRFAISPRCTELAKALEEWDYSTDHPRKDEIDALRYACKRAIFPYDRMVGPHVVSTR